MLESPTPDPSPTETFRLGPNGDCRIENASDTYICPIKPWGVCLALSVQRLARYVEHIRPQSLQLQSDRMYACVFAIGLLHWFCFIKRLTACRNLNDARERLDVVTRCEVAERILLYHGEHLAQRFPPLSKIIADAKSTATSTSMMALMELGKLLFWTISWQQCTSHLRVRVRQFLGLAQHWMDHQAFQCSWTPTGFSVSCFMVSHPKSQIYSHRSGILRKYSNNLGVPILVSESGISRTISKQMLRRPFTQYTTRLRRHHTSAYWTRDPHSCRCNYGTPIYTMYSFLHGVAGLLQPTPPSTDLTGRLSFPLERRRTQYDERESDPAENVEIQ